MNKEDLSEYGFPVKEEHPIGRMDWFSAMAPDIPTWFERRQATYKDAPVPMEERPGWVKMGRVIDVPEESLEEHFFRWRWYYAEKMINFKK